MKVAVIGAGPSGLITLKYLRSAQKQLDCEAVEVRVFDSASQIGGTFAARAYENAELVSSRQLTTFSDFRLPTSGDFLSAVEYIHYLNDFCSEFDLWQDIKLNTEVVQVTRYSSGHIVKYRDPSGQAEWYCDAVAVCSGLHVKPHLPNIRGLEYVDQVLHSSEFKSSKQFKRARAVMVVGAGETGADISYLAANTPGVEQVVLCHKDGIHFAPKRNPGPKVLPFLRARTNDIDAGIPLDVSRANIFDTAYVHKFLRSHDWLLWIFYRLYIKAVLYLSTGTTSGFDQWIGALSPERDDPSKIFFNKSSAAAHSISGPYRPRPYELRYWLYKLKSMIIHSPLPRTKGLNIDIAPLPKNINREGIVKFIDNGRLEYQRLKHLTIRPDCVVLCTGYEQSFPFFNQNRKKQYLGPESADVRQIWKRGDHTVGYIGFVRPSLGAIPPLAEMQAQLWILRLLAPEKIKGKLQPGDEYHYRLRHSPGARITYGVDHESYAYQLARDMASAPGFSDIIQLAQGQSFKYSGRLFIVWAFGANFNTKFRLIGPWRLGCAANMLASDEFWQTITRRPLLFGKLTRLLFSKISNLTVC